MANQQVFSLGVLSPLQSVHLKLREYNCWSSHINTTGRDQLVFSLGVVSHLHSVHLKLREYNWCSHINTTGSDQQVFSLGVVSHLHSVQLKLRECNCWCSQKLYHRQGSASIFTWCNVATRIQLLVFSY